MREFYNFIDGYITDILMNNINISKEIKNAYNLKIKFKNEDDILLFNDSELKNLLNYLVIDGIELIEIMKKTVFICLIYIWN